MYRSGVLAWIGLALVLVLQPMSAQSTPEVREVVISVGDLAKTAQVYTSVLGFKETAQGEGASVALQRLWNLPPGTIIKKWAIFDKTDPQESIRLRVVQFDPIYERSRYEYREQDDGFLGVHICATDVFAAYKALMDSGFTAMHEPVLWAGGGGETGVGPRTAPEVFSHGPDGEGFIVNTGGGPEKCSKTGEKGKLGFGPIANVVINVTDLGKTYDFYHGILGLIETGRRWEGYGPSMETMLRLPPGTVARPIFLGNPGEHPVISVLPVEFAGAAKIDLRQRNAPPYRGMIMMSFRTSNLKELYQNMLAAGVQIVMPPIQVADKPYDGAEAFSVRDPSGVFMEFVAEK